MKYKYYLRDTTSPRKLKKKVCRTSPSWHVCISTLSVALLCPIRVPMPGWRSSRGDMRASRPGFQLSPSVCQYVCMSYVDTGDDLGRFPIPTWSCSLKGLSHEIDFKNVDENWQILALTRAAAGYWIFQRHLWFLVEIKHLLSSKC